MMRVAFAICLCFVSVASASAQDDRSVGLTIAYPGSAGVIWQIGDRVAIRGDAIFSSSWTDAAAPSAGDEPFQFVGSSASTSGNTFGFGVSVLVTVARWERLRAYVAPRAAYVRSSIKSEISFTGAFPVRGAVQPATFETRSSAETYSASFGTQYGLGERFAAFGEVGVAYASMRSPDSTTLVFSSGGSTSPIFGGVTSSVSSSPRPRSNSIGIRSGVGVIFFF